LASAISDVSSEAQAHRTVIFDFREATAGSNVPEVRAQCG
jgi:hypothetical protein